MGDIVGTAEGESDGKRLGVRVGAADGLAVVGTAVGVAVVGNEVGFAVGEVDGLLFEIDNRVVNGWTNALGFSEQNVWTETDKDLSQQIVHRPTLSVISLETS